MATVMCVCTICTGAEAALPEKATEDGGGFSYSKLKAMQDEAAAKVCTGEWMYVSRHPHPHSLAANLDEVQYQAYSCPACEDCWATTGAPAAAAPSMETGGWGADLLEKTKHRRARSNIVLGH
eukprot:1158450-Pelagomonas_calceolata.AAC.3